MATITDVKTSSTTRNVRRTAVIAVVSAMALGGAAEAATPKPWQWTNTQAAAKTDKILRDLVYLDGTTGRFGAAACKGVGKPVARRYSAFACSFTFKAGGPASTVQTRRAWLKIRAAGVGGACVSLVSLAAVPAGCLRAVAAISPPKDWNAGVEVRRAMQKRMDPSKTYTWQSFTKLDCLGADGWYQCSFGEGVSGAATVVFVKSGSRVTFTQLVCAPDIGAAYPEGCRFP